MSDRDQFQYLLFSNAFCQVFIRIAGFSGAAAVVLAAYGANKFHLTKKHDPHLKSIFEVANKLHCYNSIALMAVPFAGLPWLTGSLLVCGIIFFSGTCYYAVITGYHRSHDRLILLGAVITVLAWASMMFF